MDFTSWLAGTCSFECAICGERFPHSIAFYCHLAADHKTRPADYAAKHGSALVDRGTVECAHCLETIDHEKGSLKKHFAQKHPGERMRDYFEQFVKPSQGSRSAIDPASDGGDGPRVEGAAIDQEREDNRRPPRRKGRSRSSSSKDGHNKENLPEKRRRSTKPGEEEQEEKEMAVNCSVCGEALRGAKSLLEHLKTKHRKVKVAKEVQKVGKGDKTFKCDSCGKILAGFEAASTHIVKHNHKTFSTVLSDVANMKKEVDREDKSKGDVAPQNDVPTETLEDCGEKSKDDVVTVNPGDAKAPKHDIYIDYMTIGDEVTLEEESTEPQPHVSDQCEDPADPLVIELPAPRPVVQVAKCPLSSTCPELLADERNFTAHLVSTHQISDSQTLDILVSKIKTHYVEI